MEKEIERGLSRYERFAEEQFRKPEHRHLVIGLKRLNHGLSTIKNTWQRSERSQTLDELRNLLMRQQELELTVEQIDNRFLREYVRDLLDKFAVARRSLFEEVRWDVEAMKPLANASDQQEGPGE